MPQEIEQATLVSQSTLRPNLGVAKLALFNQDGTPFTVPESQKAAAQADSTASDVAGVVSDFNSLLAKLRTAGIIAES